VRVYVAGPLFNDMERERNAAIGRFLEGLGYEAYLPQDKAQLGKLAAAIDAATARARIFEQDLQALRECDAVLCLLDGRVPDEGMCVELGIAHALGKACLGYRTDWRVHDPGGLNLMIEGCLGGRLAGTLPELEALLNAL